jgi:hypothetical protein
MKIGAIGADFFESRRSEVREQADQDDDRNRYAEDQQEDGTHRISRFGQW